MIEIMLLGVLVALIKIAELATVIPGLALFVLGRAGLPAGSDGGRFDTHLAWARIEWADERPLPGERNTACVPEARR